MHIDMLLDQNAQVCYAYLADVYGETETEMFSSDWFKRGWTLQELLAPEIVVFFNHHWVEMGTKFTLAQTICAITRIDFIAYEHEDASVAQKMSWAAGRKTTRIEDRAYCLMGLFGVNMPLLYGEGEDAFLRLQMSILGKTVDDSIFAWEKDGELDNRPGLLATSPDDFHRSRYIVRMSQLTFRRNLGTDHDAISGQYSLTSMGLELQGGIKQSRHSGFAFLLPLACARGLKGNSMEESVICIQLLKRFTPYIFERAPGVLLSYTREDLLDIDPVALGAGKYTINGRLWVTQQMPIVRRESGSLRFKMDDTGVQNNGYNQLRIEECSKPSKEHHNIRLMECTHSNTFTYTKEGVGLFDLELLNEGGKLKVWVNHHDVYASSSENVGVAVKKKAEDGVPFYEIKIHLIRRYFYEGVFCCELL